MSTLVQEAFQEQDTVVIKVIHEDIGNIADLLKAIWFTKYCSIEMEELVVGFGELWYAIFSAAKLLAHSILCRSAQLLDALLRKKGFNAAWLDARNVLFVSRGETGPIVDWERSKAETDKWLAALPANVDVVAVTG
jgi:aspartokinase/homoserine dehydrogenase 1